MAVWSTIRNSALEGALRIDAEYYQPEYMEMDKLLNEGGAVHVDELLSDIRYGIYTEPHYVEEGIDFIRALNLQEYSIESEILKIRREVMPSDKYRLRERDVLIVRSGANVGNVGIIQAPFIGATFGSYTIRLRFNEKINPYFAYVFFKTRVGRLQTVRFRTGLAQPNINIPNLKLLKIPANIPQAQQEMVEEKVKGSHRYVLESESLYLRAEQMLLTELGLDKVDLSQQRYHSVALSRTQDISRLDAEHFQSKYDKLVQHLRSRGRAKQIGDFLAEPIQKGVTPEYDADGTVVAVNSQHLGQHCLNFDGTDRTTEHFWERNERAHIRYLDVMIYATGAYIGRTNAYLEDRDALAGVDLILVRPNSSCNPLYLAVYLNTLAGLWQAEKFASGSAQRHIYPNDVAQFSVCLPSEELQSNVASLAIQSYEARRKARSLLEAAKKRVEELVERS